ncbi:hypothetical protein PGTUg99_002315 [Puccinia graminis f. sp. tritici]|uniref:Uncharacterized protein n=1 Tax=Puccinia graminis f. sp. tritici TaxID=56615 RepID=A0A5B0SK21_PUCGR|nr:hypothetical protein PGTUg99_002315 [Puccinia graminis f. sp. tritici]
MVAMVSYFTLILLFHVSHQALTPATTEAVVEHATQLPGHSTQPSTSSLIPSTTEEVVENATQLPGHSTQPSTSSQIEVSEGSDVAPPKTVDSKRPKPPLTNCPICQDSLLRRMACAICKEKPPPLDPKRLKKLQSRPRPPPEVDNDDVIAAEQLQREIYEAENADDLGLTRSGEPEFGRSMSFPNQGYLGFRDGSSSPGFPHRENHLVPDLSAPHVEPHHSESLHALGGTELHGDDEALARAVSLSLGNEVHEPSHSEDPIHALGNHSSLQDTSGDFALAMALSLQEGLDHRSQLPSPGLEHAWSEPDTSQDEHFAREIERQINEQNSEQVAREIERQLNEQNSEQVAREIERQLNEQTSEQVAQQIQRQLNEQASPWPQPIPHRYPQSTPSRYPQPTPQMNTNQGVAGQGHFIQFKKEQLEFFKEEPITLWMNRLLKNYAMQHPNS